MSEPDPRRSRARASLIQGVVLCGTAVAAGAFGAHALELADRAAEWWSTAVQYQMFHGLALLACGVLAERGRRVAVASWCFFLGTMVFSGTLYAMALGAPRWLGAVTPLGGLLLIVGWIALLAAALRMGRRSDPAL